MRYGWKKTAATGKNWSDIADIMAEITGSEDVAVVLEGYHSCVSARGIKKTTREQ